MDAPDAAPCLDTDSDIFNCGVCGRVCDVLNGTPGCEAGECVVESCDDGFFDADGEVRTGCELEAACLDGAGCQTICDSTGTMVCENGELAECVAPTTELCNGIDDTCDGTCDEGPLADCRVGVHRLYDGDTSHLFTTDLSQSMTTVFDIVEDADDFHLYTEQVPGTEALYLCDKTQQNRFMLTDQADCESAGTVVMILGYWATEEQCGSTPLFRTFRTSSNDHFYTTSEAERDNAVAMFGHTSEGIVGHVWPSP